MRKHWMGLDSGRVVKGRVGLLLTLAMVLGGAPAFAQTAATLLQQQPRLRRPRRRRHPGSKKSSSPPRSASNCRSTFRSH